ncbi:MULTISPECIES: DUF6879 family protein [Streptomyces]|uniref:DUF6879 family protein n=1 Tax=Streptomyces TaxID=1883 RepID=UPI0024A1F5D7|nr:DUF6879 family protein [Streptomyces sp. NBRC 13847]GLW16526.1 hypothetical protein Stsp01_32690 [Streptomyces sp. NBRC 13847]
MSELMESAQHSAVFLQMRDLYNVSSEAEDFATWQRTGQREMDPESEYWKTWVKTASQAAARGVVIRRARIVSEPVSDSIRYLHAGVAVNINAGEQVRWLPRRRASDIALPGNDFWLFDGHVIRWNHFAGDGDVTVHEHSDDPATAKLCADAFEAVWARAIPHDQYEIG